MKQLIQTFSANGFLLTERWITSEAEYVAHMREMAAEYEGCYTVTVESEPANPRPKWAMSQEEFEQTMPEQAERRRRQWEQNRQEAIAFVENGGGPL